jgi:F0F1-type ATP synthase membrane subunit c/vacuolar-type H+-ATPase subunit K
MAGDAFMLVGLAALGHALALGLTIGVYRNLDARAKKRQAE